MPQLLQRPLFSALRLPPFSFQTRCFTQIAARQDLMRQPQIARGPPPKERSFRVMGKEMMAMPSDMGLLDDTFVTPTRKNLPSLFNSPKNLLRLQWYRLRSRMRDYFSLLILKFASPKESKRWFVRKVKLVSGQIAPTAVALHKRMYTALAEGDVVVLRKLCADGIYDSFRARIARRGLGEKVKWELVEYKGRAKVVSNRAARLPIEGAAVRQAVVRIRSRQMLTRYAANGTQIKGTGEVRDVVEYVVVQRRYWHWVEDEWQVWGLTEETKLEDVEQWERRVNGLT